MDIKLLPEGARVLVDTNLFLYQISGSSLECKQLFARIAAREIEGHITTTIIAEVLHRQMLLEAVSKRLVAPGKALKKLKANPGIITSLTGYTTEVEKLLRLPFSIIENHGSRHRPQP